MSKQGVVHTIKHDKLYFDRLHRAARGDYQFARAYCSTTVAPKPTENFLENARKGTAIHMGLKQRSIYLVDKGAFNGHES